MKLTEVKRVLERRIGTSLEELDDYLHVYKFGPDTLMALVGYYLEEGHADPASLEEIAGEVDKFLWSYAEAGSVNPDTFTALFKVHTMASPLLASNVSCECCARLMVVSMHSGISKLVSPIA